MIRPLKGFVLVEPIEEDNKRGMVYVPDSAKDKPSKGILVASGNELDEKGVSLGNTVVYKKWVNETISYEGKEYIFVKVEDLLAVIE